MQMMTMRLLLAALMSAACSNSSTAEGEGEGGLEGEGEEGEEGEGEEGEGEEGEGEEGEGEEGEGEEGEGEEGEGEEGEGEEGEGVCADNLAGLPPILSSRATVTEPPTLVFQQTSVITDSDNPAPNLFDLSSNFSIEDGGSDQFDGAMGLTVVDLLTFEFTGDQAYDDLVFFGPTMPACAGATPVTQGNGEAQFRPSSLSRMEQALTIPQTATTLVWRAALLSGSNFDDQPSSSAVTVTGGVNQFTATFDAGRIDVANLAGLLATVALETRGILAAVDDISFEDIDGNAIAGVTNGTFDNDLQGWTINEPNEIQNVTSGNQTLFGLEVQRSFYTAPNQLWGRMTDTFTNGTAAAITATITYATDLGSDGGGAINAVGGFNQALVAWDMTGSDRDVGLVFGTALGNMTFQSATGTRADADTAFDITDGTDEITYEHIINVAPGTIETIVQFIVLSPDDTGDTALTNADPSPIAAAVVLDILANYATDGQYRTGMTQQQIDTVVNFN